MIASSICQFLNDSQNSAADLRRMHSGIHSINFLAYLPKNCIGLLPISSEISSKLKESSTYEHVILAIYIILDVTTFSFMHMHQFSLTWEDRNIISKEAIKTTPKPIPITYVGFVSHFVFASSILLSFSSCAY